MGILTRIGKTFKAIPKFLGMGSSAKEDQEVVSNKTAKIAEESKSKESKAKEDTQKEQSARSESEKKQSLVLDGIVSKAKQAKAFFEASSKKIQSDGWLDYIGSYFGASAGSKVMDKFIGVIVKNYSLVDEREIGYAVTINDILDKILDVMGDPNKKATDKVSTKEKLSEIATQIDKTKKEVESLSPVFSFGLKLLSMALSFVGMIVGSVLSFSENKTMSDVGTAATMLSGWSLFSGAKGIAKDVAKELSVFNAPEPELGCDFEEVSDDKMENGGRSRIGTPTMRAG